MRYLILYIILLASMTGYTQPTTIILVRHAEKMSGRDDPALTPKGTARAAELTRVLSAVDISSIYTTPFKRTRATVAPLAAAKSLHIKEYSPRNPADVLELAKTHAGETLVFSGHSNTIPAVLNFITGTDSYGQIDENDYDNLFIVYLHPSDEPTVLPLKYGER